MVDHCLADTKIRGHSCHSPISHHPLIAPQHSAQSNNTNIITIITIRVNRSSPCVHTHRTASANTQDRTNEQALGDGIFRAPTPRTLQIRSLTDLVTRWRCLGCYLLDRSRLHPCRTRSNQIKST